MKIKLEKLQNNYFSAVVANINHANEIIKNTQGWLLTLAIAELAFIGSVFSRPEYINLKLLFVITTFF